MPASLTKRDLSIAEIDGMLREAFGARADVSAIEEFTEGFFAAVYGARVTPAGGQPIDVVLKVAVERSTHLLRYETDLLNAEVEFFAQAASAGVLVPPLHHVDPRRRFLVTGRRPDSRWPWPATRCRPSNWNGFGASWPGSAPGCTPSAARCSVTHDRTARPDRRAGGSRSA